ncbi:MAG TPA: hypothetical protein VFI05_00310 [Nitrospiraceae bacterium]|nr:hypothetical protein [Nitrospiraceae bacterium]
MNIYALSIGVVVGVIVLLHLKATKRESTNWAYPLLLATFPVFYWAFAVYAADYAALLREFVAGAAFLVIAYIACRFKSPGTLLLLAVGYIGHAAYDVYHNLLFVNGGTPAWWPEFCGSVDVLLGGYVAYLAVSYAKNAAVA